MPWSTPEEEWPDKSLGPELDQCLRDLQEAVAARAAAIARVHALVVTARELGIIYRDIASALKIPVSTVSGTVVPAAFRAVAERSRGGGDKRV